MLNAYIPPKVFPFLNLLSLAFLFDDCQSVTLFFLDFSLKEPLFFC